MTIKEYLDELGKIRGSRLNEIIRMVNTLTPKEEAGLTTPVEEMFFDRLMAEADRDEKRFGKRTIFENVEIESDDPKLDIYRD